MTKLILTACLLGSLAAMVVAYESRESVAYAVEPPADPSTDIISAVVKACIESSGAWTQRNQGGIWEGRCVPNLGVGPSVRRGK